MLTSGLTADWATGGVAGCAGAGATGAAAATGAATLVAACAVRVAILRVTVRDAIGAAAFALVTILLCVATVFGADTAASGVAVSTVVAGALSVVGGAGETVGGGSVVAGASWANSGVDESAKATAIAAAPVRAYSLLVVVIMPEQPAKGRSGGTIIGTRRLWGDEWFSVQPFVNSEENQPHRSGCRAS